MGLILVGFVDFVCFLINIYFERWFTNWKQPWTNQRHLAAKTTQHLRFFRKGTQSWLL